MHLAEFIHQIGAAEVFDRLGADQRAARRHKRQFERLDLREAARASALGIAQTISAAPSRA